MTILYVILLDNYMFSLISYMTSIIFYRTIIYVILLDDYVFYNIVYDYIHVIFYLTVLCNMSGAPESAPAF